MQPQFPHHRKPDWQRQLFFILRKLRHRFANAGSLKNLIHQMRQADVRDEILAYLKNTPSLQALPYWIAAMVAGFLAVMFAQCFTFSSCTSPEMAANKSRILLFVSPLCFVLGSWIVHRFCPPAGGSGIPQVMAAIEMEELGATDRISELAGLKVAFVKIVSCLLCIVGGGAVGREGPTIQIAASVFHFIGKPFRKIWPTISHQSLLIAGGAAGLAAAFNTPLGGIVFAVEELSHQPFFPLQNPFNRCSHHFRYGVAMDAGPLSLFWLSSNGASSFAWHCYPGRL